MCTRILGNKPCLMPFCPETITLASIGILRYIFRRDTVARRFPSFYTYVRNWMKPRLISHMHAHCSTRTKCSTQSLGTTSAREKTHIRERLLRYINAVPKQTQVSSRSANRSIHKTTIQAGRRQTDRAAGRSTYLQV